MPVRQHHAVSFMPGLKQSCLKCLLKALLTICSNLEWFFLFSIIVLLKMIFLFLWKPSLLTPLMVRTSSSYATSLCLDLAKHTAYYTTASTYITWDFTKYRVFCTQVWYLICKLWLEIPGEMVHTQLLSPSCAPF